ncbi:MAG: pglI 2 [Lachnospiraceae bacterium]|nr:pglI 2 [Lachnospiraceae bacterium]
MFLTILTPTYNRKDKLTKLYTSLCKQTNKDFVWLIVDDGSTDCTDDLVNKFNKEKRIHIKYYWKVNGGKHTALNEGIFKVQTPLVFVVDSDDWLVDEAVEQIFQVHKKFDNFKEICGYSFMRMFSNGMVNGKCLKSDCVVDDYINIRINGNDINSDKAEVWKIENLREYPFPEFYSEKFLGEDTVWIQMAMKYKMVFLNIPIYFSDYLNDGLTKNRRKNNIQSPNGCLFRAYISLTACKSRKIKFIFFLKVLLQYQVYGKFAHKSFYELYKNSIYKGWFLVTSPGAYGLYAYWNRKYPNE